MRYINLRYFTYFTYLLTIVINSLFKNICAETGGMSCFEAKLVVVDGTVLSDPKNLASTLSNNLESTGDRAMAL